MTDEATTPEIQAEQNVTEVADFNGMTPQQRAGELERSLRNEPIDDAVEEAEAQPETVTEERNEAPPEPDEFDAKLVALQAKAQAERERVAAKKGADTERIALLKKEQELASIAYQVLEEKKSATAAMAKVQAFEKMSTQELIYEAMQRSEGDVNAVAQAFLDLNDPATIAGIQAKKREAETVHPLRKELDEIKAQLAQEAQARQAAERQSQMYAEISAAAQLSQQHAEEVPFVAKLAAKNQRLFMLRFNEARSTILQEHGQAPTGSILLQMEQDLTPELNEIRETFGWGESPGSSHSSSSAPTGGVKPKIVTNRAASQRTQVAEDGEGLPSDVRERARLLERRLR